MTIGRRELLCAAAFAAAAAPCAVAARETKGVKLIPAQRRWAPPPAQAPVREGLVDVGGVRLAYWDTGGSGAPLVLLHPATGSLKIWAYQQPVFAKAGYRVIAYSRRGHAGSESGPSDRLGTGVDDLTALLDHLKVDRFHLLGSAAGGFLGPDFALSYPGRLLSMTLACTLAGVAEPAFREGIARVLPPDFAKLPATFRELGPSYRVGYPQGVAEWERLEHAALSGPQQVRQPTKNTVLYADLAKIRTPSLVMTGGADLYLPPALMLEYASRLPDAETAVFSEAGHSAYWEEPEAFNAQVLDFLARRS